MLDHPEAIAEARAAPVARVWETVLGVPADASHTLIDAFARRPERDRRMLLGELLAEIGRATGVQLPVTVALGSPTAIDLARMVRDPHSLCFERPFKVQPGSGRPLFVLPGLGGIGLEVIGLIRHLRCAGPVYFNPPRGLDGAEPLRTLHQAVADHVACIRMVQPHGPYRLLGYSWGGLVALEIARSLRADGETIGFLGMVDPVISQADWTYRAWLQYIAARCSLHLKELRRLGSPLAAVRYGSRLVIPVVDKVVRLFGVTRLWPLAEAGEQLRAPLPAVWSAESEIVKMYRLRHYDGPVTIFATLAGHAHEVDPMKIWPSKVGELTLQWVPGDHYLTEPDVARTAQAISEALAQIK